MPRHFSMILLFVLLAASVFVIGCSNETADPLADNSTASDNYDQMDFSLPYGGLTVSDESEAFGDESLQMMMLAEDEELVDDPLADDPAVLELEAEGDQPSDPTDPNRPIFTYLRLRWGMLHGPEDTVRVTEPPCDITDWTGELHTDRGLVVVRRVVAFERPADHVIFPRLDQQTVAFVSHTRCHYDGLVIQIIERPYDETAEGYVPNVLHINLPGYQGEFGVTDLGGLDELIDVDDLGNRIQLTGFQLSDINVCPKGFLSGRFRHLPEEDVSVAASADESTGQQLGRFAGAWTNLSGRIDGFLRGGYGLNADGERVFFGKYIDRKGRFRGMLTGTWDPADDARDLATFSGQWESASGRAEGRLGGNAYSVEGYPGGFFAGRWATACDDEATDEIR
jgi:hypothetical protein